MKTLHVETMVPLRKSVVLPRISHPLTREPVGQVEIFLRVRLLLIHDLPAVHVFLIEADTELVQPQSLQHSPFLGIC